MRKKINLLLKPAVVTLITWLAIRVLKKFKPKIIAVTGSVGKTTTKDAIYAGLSQSKKIRKSEKSFNSEIGIPLTILGCNNAWSNPILWIKNFLSAIFLIILEKDYPEWLVLEVGADRPNDIKNLTKWLKPDIAVITRLPDVPVHIEYFSSPSEVHDEKLALASAVNVGGSVVYNFDDENLVKRIGELKGNKISYGRGSNSDVRVVSSDIVYDDVEDSSHPTGLECVVEYLDNKSVINIDNTIGFSYALSCAAAMAVSSVLKADTIDVVKGLSMFDIPKGRMRLVQGIKNTTIVDDSYNSSPAAVEQSLSSFKAIETGGRKICVLGDMLELGKYAGEQHKLIGKNVAKVSDILVTIGIRARKIAEGALENGMPENAIFQYEKAADAGKDFQNMLKQGDVLLVKGSQGIRLEKFIEEILLQPELKNKLLVRQEAEWQTK